VESQHI